LPLIYSPITTTTPNTKIAKIPINETSSNIIEKPHNISQQKNPLQCNVILLT
jgi:hypothetical protein